MKSTEIRKALFERGLVHCRACHSQVSRKNVEFKEDLTLKRLRVQIRCMNPSCRLFNRLSEFFVPTDQFIV
jgi:hypothetical protein